MSTSELFQGSNVGGILALLTDAMGIENRIGAAEDARGGAPRHVTWVPPERATRRYTPVVQQRDDLHLKAVHEVNPLFMVHLWGENYAACEELEQDLETALYTLFSPNGYELGPEGTQEAGDNAPTGQGRTYLFVIPIRLLRVPIPVEQHPTVTLTRATATGAVTDGQGNTNAGPNAGTTYP